MPALTPEQTKQYYAEQGTAAKPLSPLDWLKTQQPAPQAKAAQAPTTQPAIVTTTQPRKDVVQATTQLSDYQQKVQNALDTADQVRQTAEKLKAEQAKKDTQLTPEEGAILGVQYDPLSGKLTSTDPLTAYTTRQIETLDKDAETINNLLNSFSARQDETTRASVQAIQNLYNQRKNQLADINSRALEFLKSGQLASGTARYAPEISTSILSSEERAGVQRMQELDAEEAQLIAQAQIAGEEKQFRTLVAKIENANTLRKEKIDLVGKLQNMALAEQKRIDDKEQAERKAEAEDFDRQLKMTSSYALGIADQIDQLATDAQKDDYIETIASIGGFDPVILRGEVSRIIGERNKAYIQGLQEVSPGATLYDPISGKSIYTAPKPASGGVSDLTPFQQASLRNQIEDNLRANPAVKSYGELVNFGVPTVLQRFQEGDVSNISDTVLMRTLAKVTDPTTGVREEEYRTFEDAMGALGRVYKIPSKWAGTGRLTETGRSQMIKEIEDRFNARQHDYLEQYTYYNEQAARSGTTVPPPYLGTQTRNEQKTKEPQAPANIPSAKVINPNGKIVWIPMGQLNQALKEGYRQTQ